MKRYSSVFDVRKVILNTCSVLSYNDVLFNIGVILRGVPGWGYRPGEFSGSRDFEAAVLLARKGMTIFWKTKGKSSYLPRATILRFVPPNYHVCRVPPCYLSSVWLTSASPLKAAWRAGRVVVPLSKANQMNGASAERYILPIYSSKWALTKSFKSP
jgi:hypothetical protein